MVGKHSRWFRLFGAVLPLALVFAWLGPVLPARAQTQGKLLLLLDSSGSMKEKAGSQTKIAIAKAALNTVVAKLPADAQAGMRVYGATVFSRKDKGACSDSQLAVPIGTGNRAALKAAIAKYKPYGETPISYSLTQAARDLGTTGRRTVVLVSDGEETCQADPCVTAANLAERGIDLKFDVIGLHVSGKARSQLQCIADKGNGTYYDADNAAQIEESLDKLATRAFRPFRLSGAPIQGSTEPSTAPTARAGQYVDQIPGSRDDLYYRIPRTMAGSTIHVGFTADVPGETAASLFLSTAKESYCGSDTALVINIEGIKNALVGELDSWSSTPDSACNTADSLLLKISHPFEDLNGRPFELLVVEEPPVTDTRTLPPAADSWRWQPMSAAARPQTPPVPGSSISDAAILAPGAYRTTILTGEKQVYGVPLAWGQRLQVEAVIGPRKGALAKALGNVDTLNVQILSPLRGPFVLPKPDGMPANDFGMGQPDKSYRTYAGSPPVVYLNRAETDSRGNAALAGTYAVVINKSRLSDQEEFLVPYTLIVRVIGTAGTGAPPYDPGAASPSPTPMPSSTTGPATSPTTTAAPTSVASSAAPSATSPQSGPPSDLPARRNGISPVRLIQIGVGVLVAEGLIAAALVLFLRRRQR